MKDLASIVKSDAIPTEQPQPVTELERIPDQPQPTKNSYMPVQDAVIRDIELLYGNVGALVAGDIRERKEVGLKRYGTYLQPFNGRDALTDLYQEILDAVVYLRQLLTEIKLTKDLSHPLAGNYKALLDEYRNLVRLAICLRGLRN